MSCIVCGHTLHAAGYTASSPGCYETLFWCPRCGSLKDDDGDTSTPRLVERCRELIPAAERNFKPGVGLFPGDLAVIVRRLGIAEAISVPGERGE